MLSDNKEI